MSSLIDYNWGKGMYIWLLTQFYYIPWALIVNYIYFSSWKIQIKGEKIYFFEEQNSNNHLYSERYNIV